MKIDGRAIAERILNDLAKEVALLKSRGVVPTLAVILVGDNPASLSYIKQKQKAAEEIGAKVILKQLPATTTTEVLRSTIQQFNSDNNVHGIIIQRPLPKEAQPGITTTLQCVVVNKDVDGFLTESPFDIPVAAAVLTILKEVYRFIGLNPVNGRVQPLQGNFTRWLQTQSIVVIGRGETAGKPIADHLRKLGCKLMVVHSQTQNPDDIIRSADVLISCVGKPNVVRRDNIQKDAILLSVGIWRDRETKELHGDYNEGEIGRIASFYTPTPGGVGPVNVACLMQNLIQATKLSID